ncbi:MAG TPA: alpha/beta fold hydrolase [Steroidobacteraceae bacterium]|nr:alpha/beta fold hydrolase [Steroidobacteraceae bacterium]
MTNNTSASVKADSAAGQTLACKIHGHGPDLVLLHGGAGSWTHWSRNLDTLGREFRVRAFDLPGFGASPDFAHGADDEAYFHRVAEAIAADSQGPVRLVGFSFGGSVAAGAAPLLGTQLAALTLVAPGGFGVPTGRNVDIRPVRPREGVEVNVRESARHNLNQIMFTNPASADEATVDLHLHNIERARFNSRRLSWQDRLERDLEAVSVPLQMIWGAQDSMATPSVQARIERCRRFRASIRFDLIAHAGHWVQYERAAEFNAALLDFLHDTAGGLRSIP